MMFHDFSWSTPTRPTDFYFEFAKRQVGIASVQPSLNRAMYLRFCRSSCSGLRVTSSQQKKCCRHLCPTDPSVGGFSSLGICCRRIVAPLQPNRWLTKMKVWRLSRSPSSLAKPFLSCFGCLDPRKCHMRPRSSNGFSRSRGLKRLVTFIFTCKKLSQPNFL